MIVPVNPIAARALFYVLAQVEQELGVQPTLDEHDHNWRFVHNNVRVDVRASVSVPGAMFAFTGYVGLPEGFHQTGISYAQWRQAIGHEPQYTTMLQTIVRWIVDTLTSPRTTPES